MQVGAPTENPGQSRDEDRSFFGHPKGLAFIAFAEAWERFSFYGLQALLMLYMTQHLMEPENLEKVWGFAGFRSLIEAVFGQLSPLALASQTFGLYVGLIYFMPVLGGWVGDRAIGRTRAVLAGAAAMALGHFLMAFEEAFLLALAAMIIGSGLLKGNLAAQVGGLYSKGDRRRDGGYTIYVSAINIGAFTAPLACGTLGELYGWHLGFGLAGIGMLIAIAIYVAGLHYLPADRTSSPILQKSTVQHKDSRAILAILVLLAFTSFFWTIQAQVWNVYPIWVRDLVDREVVNSWSVPISWFQSLDALTVLLLAPLTIRLWGQQAKRNSEPGDLKKVAIGNLIFCMSCVVLAVGQATSGDQRVSLFWPVLFHFLVGAGYLYCAPTTLALVSRIAPERINAMLVSSYYLGLFAGGIISGWLARYYEILGPVKFWLLQGSMGIVGFILVLSLRWPFSDIFEGQGNEKR